jgi:LacI family transcriptional regulator
MARALSSTSVPIVDLRNALPDLNLPTVAISNRTVVRLAVDHFLEQGFRRFAFCGTPRGENRNQDDRCALFEGQVKDKGFHCHTYERQRPYCIG